MTLLTVLFSVSAALGADASDVLYKSLDGAVRIEQQGDNLNVISASDPAQHATLPVDIDSAPDEFHASPDGQWIFSLRHAGSCLRDGDLFHRINATKIEAYKSFNELSWKNAVKLGAQKENFLAEGACEMAAFGCWSLDSSRLLFQLRGGDKGAMKECFLYFNTKSKTFESTDYLRSLNKSKHTAPTPLACAEPIAQLPGEKELTARYELLDKQLNEAYNHRLSKLDRTRQAELREDQRDWLKRRDVGLAIYLGASPKSEEARHRLQFLGDVTAARLDDLNAPLDQDR